MFFALFVYAKLTTLGDTSAYISGSRGTSGFLTNSTGFMSFVASNLSTIMGPILVNVPFVLLAIYGVYYAVLRLTLTKKQLIFLLLMLSLPSFGVWTSIVSKESVAVFFMGIILGNIIDYNENRQTGSKLLLFIALYLCITFKPQYLIGILALFFFVFLSKKLFHNPFGKLFAIISFFILSFLVLYLFRSEINMLSYIMPAHFSQDAGSTRENTIWINDYDIFWNAPYGMFISFFGPTLDEALSKPTHLLAFIESFLIVTVFLYFLIKNFYYTYLTAMFNVYIFGLFVTVFFWILFVHYPFGALNSGSAIRYRENFFSFFMILFFYLYTLQFNFKRTRKN
jgi:hypothetical protein